MSKLFGFIDAEQCAPYPSWSLHFVFHIGNTFVKNRKKFWTIFWNKLHGHLFLDLFKQRRSKQIFKNKLFITILTFKRLTSSSCLICSCAIFNWLLAVNFSRNKISSGGQCWSSAVVSDNKVCKKSRKFKHNILISSCCSI